MAVSITRSRNGYKAEKPRRDGASSLLPMVAHAWPWENLDRISVRAYAAPSGYPFKIPEELGGSCDTFVLDGSAAVVSAGDRARSSV
jgi:hypothetical protein